MSSADITDARENYLSTVEVRIAVIQLDAGTRESKNTKRSFTLAMIDADFPSETWIHVFMVERHSAATEQNLNLL